MKVTVIIIGCVIAVQATASYDRLKTIQNDADVIDKNWVKRQKQLGPLVETELGLIRSLQADDGDYSMFLGIPYAKVDIENPFGPSIPHPKFDDIFDANDDSAMCPQIDTFTQEVTGTLDCLHLHVYVSNKVSLNNKLPVLVWVHGGGFTDGFAGRYVHGPQFLVRHDVIVVSINYRLGPYGFMCLNTPEIPGNQGLKDQRLALRWIKDNIAAFGGDENKITLMGESAGATAVDLHLLSTPDDSLFNQVIMQSGNGLIVLLGEGNVNAPFILSKKLGFDTNNVTEALSFLSKADTNSVIGATVPTSLFFKACIEKEFKNVESFITKHPLKVENPNIKNTPILAGFNNKETIMTYEPKPASDFVGYEIFTNVLKQFFNYDDELTERTKIARRFYIGDEDMSEAFRWTLMDFESDVSFNLPVQWTIDNYIEQGSKVYQYLFSYSGERNFFKNKLNLTEVGANHADEIGYLFNQSYNKKTPSEEDQRMIDQITTLWTNFVKYGDPTPEISELLPVKWVPVTKDKNSYLNLDSTLTLGSLPYEKRLAFWKLFYTTNLHKLILYK